MSLSERISWNVPLNGQKLQQLTDTAKVNAHNLSHTHSLNTVQNEFQTASQTNRFGLCAVSVTRTETNMQYIREGEEGLRKKAGMIKTL